MDTIKTETKTLRFEDLYSKYQSGNLVLVEPDKEECDSTFSLDYIFLQIVTPTIHVIEEVTKENNIVLHVLKGSSFLKQIIDTIEGVTPIKTKKNPALDGTKCTDKLVFAIRRLDFNVVTYLKNYSSLDIDNVLPNYKLLIEILAPHAQEHFKNLNK